MKQRKSLLVFLVLFCILWHQASSTEEKCQNSSDCLLASQVCLNGRCKNCANDQECETNSFHLKYCSEGDCIECLSYLDCFSATKSRCSARRCQPCNQHSDCFHIGEFCEHGTCVQCLSNKNCLDPLLSKCDAGKCAKCEMDSDCRHLSKGSADAVECLNSECVFKAYYKVRIFETTGPTSITTTRDRPLRLLINNIHNPFDDVSITWLEAPSNPKKLKVPIRERPQLKSDPYTLVLEPYELDSQSTYKFEVLAQTQMGAKQREVFTVDVKRAPLVPWISEGNKKFPIIGDLILSAAESRDPDLDAEGGEKPSYSYKWSCEIERKSGPCLANDGSKVDLSTESKSILKIKKNWLKLSVPYQFCLRFGSRRDEKTRISEKICRTVEFCSNCIFASLDIPQSITAGISESMLVTTKLIPPYHVQSDIKYEWVVHPKDVTFYSHEGSLKIYAKSEFSGNLKIDLKLLVNNKRLETSLSASVAINPPPVIKSFVVEPTTGNGYEQLFKFRVEETHDESLPAEFMFAYSHQMEISESERVYTPLTDWQYSSSFQSVLPFGSQLHEEKLIIKASVRDSFEHASSSYAFVSSIQRNQLDTSTLIHYLDKLIPSSPKTKSQLQMLVATTMIAQGIQIYDENLMKSSKSACPRCSGRGKCSPTLKSCKCVKKSGLPDCSKSLAEIKKHLEFKNTILSRMHDQYHQLTPNEFTLKHGLLTAKALLSWQHTINNLLIERSLNITKEIISDFITFDLDITAEIRTLLTEIASGLASYISQSGWTGSTLISYIQQELAEITKMIHFFSLKMVLPGEPGVISQSSFFNTMSLRLNSALLNKETHYKFKNSQLPMGKLLPNSIQPRGQTIFDVQYTVWEINPFNLSSKEENFVFFDFYEYDSISKSSVKANPKSLQIYYPKFENEKIKCRRGCENRGDSKFLGILALKCECISLESLSLWQELEKITSLLNIEALLEYQLEEKYLFYVTPVITIIGGCFGMVVLFWALYDCATVVFFEKSINPEEMSWTNKMIALIKCSHGFSSPFFMHTPVMSRFKRNILFYQRNAGIMAYSAIFMMGVDHSKSTVFQYWILSLLPMCSVMLIHGALAYLFTSDRRAEWVPSAKSKNGKKFGDDLVIKYSASAIKELLGWILLLLAMCSYVYIVLIISTANAREKLQAVNDWLVRFGIQLLIDCLVIQNLKIFWNVFCISLVFRFQNSRTRLRKFLLRSTDSLVVLCTLVVSLVYVKHEIFV